MKIKYLFLLILTITLIGCEKDDDVKYQRQSYDINEKSKINDKNLFSFHESLHDNNYSDNTSGNKNDNSFLSNDTISGEDEANFNNDSGDDNKSVKSNVEIENEKTNSVPEEPIVEIAPSSLLDSFTTNILTTDSNRYNNIKIVSDRLNGHILNPRGNFFI